MEKATLAGGCFWCTEGIFKKIKGVIEVASGYSGGKTKNPNYEEVSTGETNHAEAVQLTFDPKIISYKDILYIFFKTHDPTTKDKQGADVGSQYRSVIFYHNEGQRKIAEETKKGLQSEFPKEIVTEIAPYVTFYQAENYHQDFYEKNPNQMYCRLVIDPKIQKLRKDFKDYLK